MLNQVAKPGDWFTMQLTVVDQSRTVFSASSVGAMTSCTFRGKYLFASSFGTRVLSAKEWSAEGQEQ
jgi:hypothetical protein